MSRVEVRTEDLLAAAVAVALALFVGIRSALDEIRLSPEDTWDVFFTLAPVSVLIFGASVRFALGREGGGASGVFRRIGRVLRDWSPFFFFFLLYETFAQNVWKALLPRDRDAELLRLDRLLFGETPALRLESLVHPVLTDVLAVAYFLHLVLPPILAWIWYRRDLRVFRHLLLSIFLAGVIGVFGYLMVPAVGPGSAFPESFRGGLTGLFYGPVTWTLDQARAPRDVFPSLHVGISTIVLVFARKRGRIAFWIVLPLVAANWMSTLYLRYHYMVDVIAGWAVAPLAVAAGAAFLALEDRLRRRSSRLGDSSRGVAL